MSADNNTLRVAILGSCSVLATIPLMAVAPFVSIPPLTNLAIGTLAAGCTSMILTSILRLRGTQSSLRKKQHQLEQEAKALNDHAILSMTDSDTRICYVNQKFLDATGYAPEDVIGKEPVEFYEKKDAAFYTDINKRLRRGESWSGETRMRCKDGSIMYSQTTILPRDDDQGRWQGTIAVRTDTTEMRRAAAAIDTVAALRGLSEPVVMFMPDSLELVFMNRAAKETVGWSGDTYLGKSVSDVPLDLDIDRLRDGLRQLDEPGTEQVVLRFMHMGATFDAGLQMITLQSGERRCFAIFRDMSGEVELARAREEFIATVSHELRTPLTAIKGAMGLLLSGATGTLPDKSRDFVAIAHRNAERLVLIVNDILDLEKIVAGKMEFRREVGDLCEVLIEAKAANQAYADQYGVTVRLEGTDSPALADFDAARILQVITNLLSNACKFSDKGSEVVGAIAVEDEVVKVSIIDNGIGIPEEDLPRMFDRFQQASNADRHHRDSSGLGLSIVKAIVEKHGGTTELSSTLGVGTTVSFSLPRAVNASWPKKLHVVAG
ncbi:PAS domain-containing sensor histidine kinase [Frigidibacter sp. ROC022]|uniref:PAS domain-containing sensor histidine kinase n=1 Tax=Frigidibacter sp. ROC022 TaxID=2971796 RepID=UPI00215A1714|nr:ATP-binding protein [Frigidibacter sp. ROC022]MCR8726086.1 ATP-binding protein [Frigidibacter sp. ROC022]